MDSGHELPICGMSEVERCSPVGGEVILHVLACPSVLPVCSGFDVCSSKLPGFNSFRTKDVSVNLGQLVPLVVGPLPVEGVCRAAVIEARNRFLKRRVTGVASSTSLSAPIGLVGAVTAVGLVRPLSEWDRRDSVPSRGREGYVVSLKSGERVVGAVGGRVKPIPGPWDGQGLPGEVGG